MLSAHAFWILEPGRGEIRDASFEPAADAVVVRALFSGISRGTEARVFKGLVPPTEYQRMRAPFQDGEFPAPVKYGYSSVGVVEQGPSSLIGRTVFALYPHQTRYALPISALHVLPDSIPPERAVLASNLETAVNTLWDARPHIGDRIVVIGGGAVGCLVAWLAGRIAGCRVELVDVNGRRAETARALGVAFAEPSSASGEADLVIHTSGSQDGLTLALRLAAFEATVLEASWFGSASVALPLGEAFHSRRLTIKSTQVGHVPAGQRARWTTARRLDLALSLLTDPALDQLITGESAFAELPEVMAQLAARPGNTLCHRIRY
jgi:NADPH:quinone reductase-like Zn-dependent oxidoreductase